MPHSSIFPYLLTFQLRKFLYEVQTQGEEKSKKRGEMSSGVKEEEKEKTYRINAI